jgi:UDP-3-O-[3-hydroxymyristoyl] glucosamine N-acyltransferase
MAAAPAGTTLAELARRTGTQVEGDGATAIARVTTLERGGADAIAFLANPKYRAQLAGTSAAAVIVAPEAAGGTDKPKLVSAQPYATYAKVAAILHPPRRAPAGVHPSAVVDASARIDATASIGPLVAIGARAIVGARAVIGPGAVIGADAEIGDDVVLHGNVTVYDGCVVGPRTMVHSGAVIGADGFGMAEEEGRWLRIPQVGRVVVGADCDIGANTTIDRGAIEDTVIEDDVKLDNQIQIAHNCRIGRHTAIAGCVGIAGSASIGRNCRIGGAAGIGGHISIADGTVIGGGTSVTSTIDRPGVYTGMFPVLPHRDWQKVAARLRRLDELADRVRALERALADQGVRS